MYHCCSMKCAISYIKLAYKAEVLFDQSVDRSITPVDGSNQAVLVEIRECCLWSDRARTTNI